MIYLLSQMVLALALAAVCGGALGWILHRSTQEKESGNFKSIINRQRQQLSHLQSEIAMLTDDYDELQRQSHDELIELREASQQIPYLSTNLEKSQLLVSQMLKKHESQLRELTTQNQVLTTKLKDVEHSEQAFNKLQADLDSARRNQASSFTETSATVHQSANEASTSTADPQSLDESTPSAANDLSEGLVDEQPAEVDASNPPADTAQPVSQDNDLAAEKITGFDSESGESLDVSEPDPVIPVLSTRPGKTSKSDSLGDTQRVISNARNTSSWASAPLSVVQSEVSQAASAQKTPHSETDQSASNRATAEGKELLDENLDDVHVVVDEDILGIDDFESDSDIDELGDATISLSENDFDELESNEEFAQTIDNSPVIFLNADATEAGADDDHASAGLTTRRAPKADTELELPELPELPSDVFDVDPFDQVIEIGDDLQKELDDDESSGNEFGTEFGTESGTESNAFEPVERHDDLQQIVGIDPLTEKALNDLGITSYAQLAKLKHHEIETIANALKIVPARIEHDDWVGNARRQLEDVLEEL